MDTAASAAESDIVRMKRVLVRLAKGLAWTVAGVIALVVVLYLTVLAVNLRDESPSAAALQLAAIHRDRPKVQDADNGYVYMTGFSAPADVDPTVAGVQRIEWIGRQHEQRHSRTAEKYPFETPDTERTPRSAEVVSISPKCRESARACLTALEGHDDVLRDWLVSEKWLLDRYLILLRHPGWVEVDPADLSTRLPQYHSGLEGQQLLHMQAYLLAGQGDAPAVKTLLEQDVQFWRRTLASADILISKMIAVAALNRTFEFGNLALRRLPAERQLEAMPAEWNVPLTDTERSLLRTYAGELVFGDQVMQNALNDGAVEHALEWNRDTDPTLTDRVRNALFRPMYRPQATSNLRAEMFVRSDEALQVPFDQLRAGFERADALLGDPVAKPGVLHWLYNPMGKVLSLIGGYAYSKYAVRVADLEGTRRAAVLAVELRARRVAASDVAAELGKVAIRTPYDREPFTWDAADPSIVFVGMQLGERGRHALQY